MEANEIWLEDFHRTEETDFGKAQIKPHAHQDPGERSSVPTRDWTRLACEYPGVSGRGMGWQCLAKGPGGQHAQILLKKVPTRFGLRPNKREGTQIHPSVENWIKYLLSMAPRRDERSYSTFKVRRASSEEIPLFQGKEQELWFAGAAIKRYPTSKVRESHVRW